MLQSYLKIALRTLARHKAYTAINIGGLAVGITGCLLMALFIRHELRYDRFHERADRIFRVVPDYHHQGQVGRFATNGAPWGPALVQTFPEVQQAVRFRYVQSALVQRGEQVAYEYGGLFADSTVFSVFSLPLVRGDPERALRIPDGIVLTERMALRYFSNDDPMGQTLTVEGADLVVTGVLRNVPSNAHMDFDFLLPFSRHEAIHPDWIGQWGLYNYFVYVLLDRPGAASGLEAKLPVFEDRHLDPEEARRTVTQLQPLTRIHLYSHRNGEFKPNGSVTTLSMLGAIAVFILLIACINFMNLTTARSANRAREVGIRKVVGAQRRQLVGQFLGEAILVCAFAVLASLLLVELFLPTFNRLTQRTLTVQYTEDGGLLLGIVVLGLVAGILAGSYPAFYLSGFRPAAVLKGASRAGRRATRLRKGLVVVQFALSITLLISVGVIYQQLGYVQDKDLGFNDEQVLVIPMRDALIEQNIETVKAAFLRDPNVTHVAASSGNLAGGDWGSSLRPEGDDDASAQATRIFCIDPDYIPAMEMRLVAGRNLSPEFPTDAADALLINEAAARALGLDDLVGQRLEVAGWRTGTVVGVVADFHFQSLHEAIMPLTMFYSRDDLHFFNVRVRPERLTATLAGLRDTWHTFVPERPFVYTFADESFARYYRAEQRLGQIFSAFAALAILIACLGLFGLASFTAEQRRKEVGIRKVMGATVSHIVLLFSRDFARLVLIAFVLAVPGTYAAMDHWLQGSPTA